jgi:hypothetical protein
MDLRSQLVGRAHNRRTSRPESKIVHTQPALTAAHRSDLLKRLIVIVKGENSSVRANAERECRYRDGREALALCDASEAVAKILK